MASWPVTRKDATCRHGISSFSEAVFAKGQGSSSRHEQSLRRRDAAEADRCTESSGEEVVEAAWIGVCRQEVRSAVARLSPAQREALELAYFGGLSYREVAEKLRIPPGTAKTRLRDGMIRLRALLPHLEADLP